MKKIYLLDRIIIIVCIAGLFLFQTTSLFAGRPHANLDQIRNGPALSPVSPAVWVNGNANPSQSHFIEGNSLAYRVVMTDMPVGTIAYLDIEFDTKRSDKHAFDFITSYNNIEPHQQIWGHAAEIIDPLIGYPALQGTAPDLARIPVPADQENGNPAGAFSSLPDGLKNMTIWGATFQQGPNGKIEYLIQDPLTGNYASTRVRIYFTPSRSTVILSWGGHIASQQNWGFGQSASFIHGSPYHTRLIGWNFGNLGSQDRSMDAASVAYVPFSDFDGPTDVCGYQFVTYELKTAPDPTVTYLWSLWYNTANATVIGSLTGTSITVYTGGGSTGTFRVQLTSTKIFEGSYLTSTTFKNVTVHDPDCSIYSVGTGPEELYPGEYRLFRGQPAPSGRTYSYSWTIQGNGTISGPTDQQYVQVIAGQNCYLPFTLSLTIVESGCIKTCEKEVTVRDIIPPEITCPPDITIDDTASIDPSNTGWATATDNCGPATITYYDVIKKVMGDFTFYRAWTAKDSAGNESMCYQTINVQSTTISKPGSPPVTGENSGSAVTPDLNAGSSAGIYLFAYPNPANKKVTIEVLFNRKAEGSIEIYNMLGNKVGEIVKTGFEENTRYSYTWEPPASLPRGIYLIRAAAGSGAQHFRVALIN